MKYYKINYDSILLQADHMGKLSQKLEVISQELKKINISMDQTLKKDDHISILLSQSQKSINDNIKNTRHCANKLTQIVEIYKSAEIICLENQVQNNYETNSQREPTYINSFKTTVNSDILVDNWLMELVFRDKIQPLN